MMREEFDERCEEAAAILGKEGYPIATDKEYKWIEFVYTWHPAIETKTDIAILWVMGQMSIIGAMYEAASNMKDYDDDIREADAKLTEIRADRDHYMEQLKKGGFF